MISGPYNKQLQRTVKDKVPSRKAQCSAAELRRYATPLPRARSVLAVALTALAALVAAQEPICNPCVDGPEMFEHRGIQAPRDPPSAYPASPRAYALAPDLCPVDIQPIVQPSPQFPEYGEWQLSVIISFLVDKDGNVLTPRVRVVKWTLAGEIGTIPTSFEKAIVDATSEWRFPPRSRACTGSIWRDFSHAF